MTIEEKAAAYDDLITKIVAALKAQGYGTADYVTYDEWKARALACEGTDLEPEPEPQPQPTTAWKNKWALATVAAWDAKLIESYTGSITDTSNGIRFQVAGPASKPGGRVELQSHRPEHGGAPIPSEQAYEWEFLIPGHVQLSSGRSDDNNTICQIHGNNNAKYTGGISVRPNGEVVLRNSGGRYLGPGNTYEFMRAITFGTFQRDRWHKVRIEADWQQTKTGYIRARLDNGQWFGVENAATASEIADSQMFRLGFYPADVPGASGLEMLARNCVTQLRA